jgi:hypothetical protein
MAPVFSVLVWRARVVPLRARSRECVARKASYWSEDEHPTWPHVVLPALASNEALGSVDVEGNSSRKNGNQPLTAPLPAPARKCWGRSGKGLISSTLIRDAAILRSHRVDRLCGEKEN